MNNSRKLFLILFSVLVFGGLISGYVYYSSLLSGPCSAAFATVNSDAAFVVEVREPINSWEKISQTSWWKNLQNASWFREQDKNLKFLDSLIYNNTRLALLFRNHPVFISGYKSGSDLEILVHMAVSGDAQKNAFYQALEKAYKQSINKTEYKNTAIYSINTGSSEKPFLYTIGSGVFTGGYDMSRIESAIDQLSMDSIPLHVIQLDNIRKMAGVKSEATVYINYEHFFKVPGLLVNSNHQQAINGLKEFAQWGLLDVGIRDEDIFWNGISITADSLNSGEYEDFLSVFANASPVNMNLSNILPDNTAGFIWFGTGGLGIYFEEYQKFLNYHGLSEKRDLALEKFEYGFGMDLEESFASWSGSGVAIATICIEGNCFKTICIEAIDADKAKNDLELIRSAMQQSENNEVQQYSPEALFPLIFGELFPDLPVNEYVILNDHVIFGDQDKLNYILDKVTSGNVLGQNIEYRELMEKASKQSNVLVYLSMPLGNSMIGHYGNEQLIRNYEQYGSVYDGISKMALQISRENNIYYTYLYTGMKRTVSTQPLAEAAGSEENNVFWKTSLGSASSFKPQVVINHYDKSREIILQDGKHQVHLISNEGKVLWTKKLDEKILGGVTQVDLYKNGKLQYLFNTPSFIYAIDRKGNMVENYPVKLPSAATNPVAVFDYENKRDYRFMVACANGQTYNYNKNGKIVKGWDFEHAINQITKPLQHFLVDGKDYIVIAPDNGQLYIADRRGKIRVDPGQRIISSKNNNWALINEPHSGLIGTDSTGMVHEVYFSGKTNSTRLQPFSGQHLFAYHDINGDRKKDFVIFDNLKLQVYNRDGSLIYSHQLKTPVLNEILIFDFPGRITKIGLVSPETQQLFLFEPDGTMSEGFPLQGGGLFTISDINNDGRFNLITSDIEGNLIVFKLK